MATIPPITKWSKSKNYEQYSYHIPREKGWYLLTFHPRTEDYELTYIEEGGERRIGVSHPNFSRAVYAARQFEANGRRNQWVSGRARRPQRHRG